MNCSASWICDVVVAGLSELLLLDTRGFVEKDERMRRCSGDWCERIVVLPLLPWRCRERVGSSRRIRR